MELVNMIVTVVVAILASSGLWAFLGSRHDKKDAKTKMILGLGHDRIMSLGLEYIERGYITKDEYNNLYTYLYKPYKEIGGNGSVEKIMEEVKKLPIKPASYEGKGAKK